MKDGVRSLSQIFWVMDLIHLLSDVVNRGQYGRFVTSNELFIKNAGLSVMQRTSPLSPAHLPTEPDQPELSIPTANAAQLSRSPSPHSVPSGKTSCLLYGKSSPGQVVARIVKWVCLVAFRVVRVDHQLDFGTCQLRISRVVLRFDGVLLVQGMNFFCFFMHILCG